MSCFDWFLAAVCLASLCIIAACIWPWDDLDDDDSEDEEDEEEPGIFAS